MLRKRSTLYVHATIVTVDADQTIWLDGALLIEGTRISAIDKSCVLLQAHPEARVIDCTGKIIIPGLINTHAHLGQSVLRGLAEEIPLHSWLCDAIWPLEASYEGEDGYVAARLTIAEMLKSGTTCFLEALLPPAVGMDNVARAIQESGIRACVGKLVKVVDKSAENKLPDPRDCDASEVSIESALIARDKYHLSCEGRLHVWMAPVTPRGSSEAAHKAIGDKCAEHGIPITMHCAEAPKDIAIYRECYGCTPMEFCKRTNLLGKGRTTVLAHMVNLDLEKDLPLLHETGTTVAHNPSSNCKLASGIAAIPEMILGSVNVSLGTDGAPCANTYDMIQEMRLSSLLQKGSRRDASIMTAQQVLKMATINGAHALGLERDIGSLELGKKADMVIIEPSGLQCMPFDAQQIEEGGVDPVTTVVFSCTGADVSMVVVNGNILLEDRVLLDCDEANIKVQAQQVIRRLRRVSGIRNKLRINIR